MAKVLLVGIEPASAGQISQALADSRHEVECKPCGLSPLELHEADVVFAGGKPSQYLPLLQRVRAALPTLPFVVVTRLPETAEWIDALEAGATDYCSFPLSANQLKWLLDSVLPRRAAAAF
jgi:DNA-binding response OmpR family regulator